MVGLYGQVIPATGWTPTAFEHSWGDDDPIEHMPRFEEGIVGDPLDTDLFEFGINSVSYWLPDDDVVWVADGRNMGIPREELYE